MNSTFKLNASIRMIAHRGLSGLERENTNAAFVAAGNRSYYGVETDVHVTKDGKFIIIHDDDPKRVTGTEGVVEEMTFEALRHLHLKDMDENPRNDLILPSLEEYIRICKKYGKECVLELKKHMEPEHISRIVDIIRAEGWLDRTTFISFDLSNMICLREMLPDQKLQYLVSKDTEDLLDVLRQNHLDLDIRFSALTPELVDNCHKAGLLVNVWTVNTLEDGRRMVDMGVDFITTNILE